MHQLTNQSIEKRNAYPIRVMQFGGGNFLRAFTDWMIEELNEKTTFKGNIAVIKPTERGDYSALRQQDGLFHVILNGIKGGQLISQKKLITCVSKVIHPYREWEAYLQLAENPDIRFIISNTTESGIRFNASDKLEDKPPREFPAKLTAWLYHRFQHFSGDLAKTCILLPLELVEQNGDLLKNCLLQYAKSWNLGSDFRSWVEAQTYCNTLVDRIVSGYPEKEAERLKEELGFEDKLLVAGEYYHSWVIQAPDHVQEELPFSQTDLNVKFVEDLDIHRKIKVRILNGAHTAMVPVAYLSGARTVLEAMQNEQVSNYIEALLFREVVPSIAYSKTELEAFANDVLDRFRNPTLQHRLLDISLNSTSKYVTRLLPSLLQYQQQKQQLPKRVVFALAALIRFYKGDWQGEAIPLRDAADRLAFFEKAWAENSESMDDLAAIVLSQKEIWGGDLNEVAGLTSLLGSYLKQLRASLKLSAFNFL